MLMEKNDDKKDGMLLPDTDLEKIKPNYFCLDQSKNRNGSLITFNFADVFEIEYIMFFFSVCLIECTVQFFSSPGSRSVFTFEIFKVFQRVISH